MAANKALLSSTGPQLALADGFTKSYGEVKAGVEAQGQGSLKGWSGYADVRGRFGDRYTEEGVSFGARLRY